MEGIRERLNKGGSGGVGGGPLQGRGNPSEGLDTQDSIVTVIFRVV